MSTKEKRRKYDREFRLGAVRLSHEPGQSVSGMARNLGISAYVLHRWRKQLADGGEAAFPGKGHMTPEQEEPRRLRRELADVTEERDILKKASAVFSRWHGIEVDPFILVKAAASEEAVRYLRKVE